MRTWLQEARKAKGISQQELAHRLRTSVSTVVKWEGGFTTPRFPAQQRLSQELNINVEALFESEKRSVVA